MSKNTRTFRLTALSASLAVAFGPAWAQDEEVKKLTTPDSSVSVGIGAWSNDRFQQGVYDGMRKDGAYWLLDADVVKRDDATGTWFKLNVRNLGLDTREIRAEWLRQGNIGAFVEYSRTPRDFPYTVNTGLQGIGSTSMTVSGAGANALPVSSVSLGTNRDLLQGGFFKNLLPGLDFRVTFQNEDKDGTRAWGMGYTPLFLVEPISSTTRQLEATLSYTGEKFQGRLGYYGSTYDNDHSLVWGLVRGVAQPGTTGSPNPVPLTLPLDNQAHQLYADGGYNFTRSTRGTFKLAYTRATQNESLPTFGLAAPNNRFLGAPSSLNGRFDTTLAQFGLTSRPLQQLSVVANLRYHHLNDKTPQAGFVGTNPSGPVTVHNTPLSFKTTSGKIEATYRLPRQFNLIGGIEASSQDRTVPVGSPGAVFDAQRYVPFRAKLDETTYRVQLRRSMSETVNGSIAFLHSKRDGSDLTRTNQGQSDLINPIHIADRKRDKWRFGLDWTPVERFSLQFNLEDARDRYSTGRPFGVRDGDATLYSLDGSYAVNEKWQLTAWFSHDKSKATQLGQRSPLNAATFDTVKDARLEDKGDSLGVGVRGEPTGMLKLGADVQWTRNRSRFQETVTQLGATAP